MAKAPQRPKKNSVDTILEGLGFKNYKRQDSTGRPTYLLGPHAAAGKLIVDSHLPGMNLGETRPTLSRGPEGGAYLTFSKKALKDDITKEKVETVLLEVTGSDKIKWGTHLGQPAVKIPSSRINDVMEVALAYQSDMEKTKKIKPATFLREEIIDLSGKPTNPVPPKPPTASKSKATGSEISFRSDPPAARAPAGKGKADKGPAASPLLSPTDMRKIKEALRKPLTIAEQLGITPLPPLELLIKPSRNNPSEPKTAAMPTEPTAGGAGADTKPTTAGTTRLPTIVTQPPRSTPAAARAGRPLSPAEKNFVAFAPKDKDGNPDLGADATKIGRASQIGHLAMKYGKGGKRNQYVRKAQAAVFDTLYGDSTHGKKFDDIIGKLAQYHKKDKRGSRHPGGMTAGQWKETKAKIARNQPLDRNEAKALFVDGIAGSASKHAAQLYAQALKSDSNYKKGTRDAGHPIAGPRTMAEAQTSLQKQAKLEEREPKAGVTAKPRPEQDAALRKRDPRPPTMSA